jgi:hypothetical protein
MIRRKRTCRIAFRCSERELALFSNMARERSISVSDLLRESVVIAVSAWPRPETWSSAIARAIQKGITP